MSNKKENTSSWDKVEATTNIKDSTRDHQSSLDKVEAIDAIYLKKQDE